MVAELPRILSTVLQSSIATTDAQQAFATEGITAGSITADKLRSRLDKTYVDDTKLTDHHAIIPTHKTPPSDLPAKQRNIYELVALRFMSIFLPLRFEMRLKLSSKFPSICSAPGAWS
jgi:DNA topoisomerase IA